jgi:two-component system sensor histidine kinase/response regulator
MHMHGMSGDVLAKTVLVVDDNHENVALARATLDDEGIQVSTAGNGADAITAFEKTPVDVVLLDVRMPVLDGIETSKRLRALPGGAEVAIVFVTAQRDVDTFDKALAAGGDDFITKPYRPAELVVRVHTALRLRRLAAERGELYAQLKRQRDDLQRLELHKQQLVAFLVHDLKNPVNTIELHAQRILQHAAADPRSRDAATKIDDEVRSLLRMITNLLDVGKAEEGRLVPARQHVDTNALVERALADLAVRAGASGVTLVTDVRASGVHADPGLIRRVLANLIENAIRYAPEGSEVRIAAAPAEGGVELSVADTGPGVPAEQREHVFERFVSGGDTATRTNRGLGLAFSKLAVEAHGGRIWIDDAHPGAVFHVFLPT